MRLSFANLDFSNNVGHYLFEEDIVYLNHKGLIFTCSMLEYICKIILHLQSRPVIQTNSNLSHTTLGIGLVSIFHTYFDQNQKEELPYAI